MYCSGPLRMKLIVAKRTKHAGQKAMCSFCEWIVWWLVEKLNITDVADTIRTLMYSTCNIHIIGVSLKACSLQHFGFATLSVCGPPKWACYKLQTQGHRHRRIIIIMGALHRLTRTSETNTEHHTQHKHQYHQHTHTNARRRRRRYARRVSAHRHRIVVTRCARYVCRATEPLEINELKSITALHTATTTLYTEHNAHNLQPMRDNSKVRWAYVLGVMCVCVCVLCCRRSRLDRSNRRAAAAAARCLLLMLLVVMHMLLCSVKLWWMRRDWCAVLCLWCLSSGYQLLC